MVVIDRDSFFQNWIGISQCSDYTCHLLESSVVYQNVNKQKDLSMSVSSFHWWNPKQQTMIILKADFFIHVSHSWCLWLVFFYRWIVIQWLCGYLSKRTSHYSWWSHESFQENWYQRRWLYFIGWALQNNECSKYICRYILNVLFCDNTYVTRACK